MSEGPLRVRRHDQASAPYQALLREYLRGRLALDPERPEDRRLAEDIIRAADGRFAYVSFFADGLEQSPPGDLAGLGAGEGLYRRWLAGLGLEYGRKQADAMRQVLALLAAAEEAHGWVFGAGRKTDPATGGVLTPLSEQFEGLEVGLLARLLDLDRPGAAASYDRIDPGLLVTLQTLQGVLWVWRGGGGASHFRLALKEFLPAAKGDPKLAPMLPLMHARIATRAFDAIELMRSGEDVDGTAWGLLAPLAPLVEAAVRLCSAEPVVRRWRPDELAALLRAHEEALRDQGLALERVPLFTLIAALGLRPGEAPAAPDERNDLAGWLQNRGLVKADGGDLAGAIADYDAAIGLREAIRDLLGEAWLVPLRDDLVSSLQNRGNARQNRGDLAGAIADYDAAIRLMKAIRDLPGEAWPVPLRNSLARVLQNRGAAKRNGGDLAGAIADYDAAIGLREAIGNQMGEAWPAPLRNDLAAVVQNRGNAKQNGGDLAGAIADYDAAIGLMEAIRAGPGENWPIPLRNDLARSLQNRGTAKQDGGDLAGAMADYDAAIGVMAAIRDQMGEAWPVPLRNDLADVVQNRGTAKQDGGDLAGAIADYDAAIRLREAIRDLMGEDWPVPLRNDLASSFFNRGVAKIRAGNRWGAMADIAACLAIQQPLVNDLEARCPPAYRAVLEGALRLRERLSDDPTRPE
jgi:tetratricopeptide (TPR) repeat protein